MKIQSIALNQYGYIDSTFPGSSLVDEQHKLLDKIEQFQTEGGRIALRGRTHLGRAGVVLELKEGRLQVSGHKLEPIDPTTRLEATHFEENLLQEALSAFMQGESVLIKTEGHGEALLRWDPVMPEVFAHGDDSAR